MLNLLSMSSALEPDGQAADCNPVEVGSTPTGVFSGKLCRGILPMSRGFHRVSHGFVSSQAIPSGPRPVLSRPTSVSVLRSMIATALSPVMAT